MFRNGLKALCIGVMMAGSLNVVDAHAEDNKRRELYKKYDENKDGRIKGKEAKNFRKNSPKPFDRLQNFCEDAKEKPKKYGVKIPKDTNPKKVKCKKGRIDKPYMKAWVADAPSNQ